MNSLQERSWWIKNKPDFKKLKKLLSGSFDQLTEESSNQTHKNYLDSFDWQLWQKGEALLFTREANQEGQSGDLQLLSLQGESQQEMPQTLLASPTFWWDLPASGLRDHLQKRLGVCSLEPVISVEEERWLLACRDNEQKIRVRLEVVHREVFRMDAEETPHYHQTFLTCKPLRGYEKSADEALVCLDTLLGKPASPDSPEYLLSLTGLHPEKNLLPSPLPLHSETATETALREAGHQLFAHARRYETGLLFDVDTEFLHQYRVNLRRIRSIFTLLKAALPKEVWQELKPRLSELSKSTNTLRDLDVFLLERNQFMSMLPEAFRPGLKKLFRKVEDERRVAHQQLASYFLSTVYEKNCQWLETFFTEPPLLATPLAVMPVKKVAGQKIWKRYRKICKAGLMITAETPDDQVHELRIECKKLRYLLDFFASLYPAKQNRRHVKTLKRLQTILGDFNDYTVQQEFLLQRLEKDTTSEVDSALHGLITILYQRQVEERGKVMQALQDFSAREVNADFKNCYKKQ
ncbi:CHAD domain-containing protein [Marinospirillum sp.]|uniref:CHAD domain-containing protein n=1 Tax=Marinospirillum sp. TaxID=2183934 RepID=UPI0038509B63